MRDECGDVCDLLIRELTLEGRHRAAAVLDLFLHPLVAEVQAVELGTDAPARAGLLERTFADITHPDDLEADLALTRQLVAGELSSYELEKRYVRKDGATVWVLLNVSLVRSEDGHALYGVGHVQDITARKRLELDAAAFAGRHPHAAALSPREREVLACLAGGMTSAHAASVLGISTETVETHVRRAMAKLGAKTRTQAVASALLLGLVEGRLESP